MFAETSTAMLDQHGRDQTPAPAADRARFRAKYVLDGTAPWRDVKLAPCDVPGMISDEEKQYYLWIGAIFAGIGEAVELGPWLGCSTAHILRGLSANPAFRSHVLHVVDDFVWRSSWMDQYYEFDDRPANQEDFEFLFRRYTAPYADKISVAKARICLYDGNAAVTPATWAGPPIEIIYVDCGRTLQVNDAWWDIFNGCFIPDETLIIMQDWQLYKQQPARPFNQTKLFTDSKGSRLELVHELVDGNLAAFIYRASD
jgi:hypothetical protein